MKWDRKSSADVLKCLLSFHFLHKTLLLPSVSNLYCRCYHIHRSLFKISEIVLWKIAIIRYWIYKGKRALLAQLIACTFAQKRIIPELSKTYHHLVENLLSPYITQLSSKLSGLRGLLMISWRSSQKRAILPQLYLWAILILRVQYLLLCCDFVWN